MMLLHSTNYTHAHKYIYAVGFSVGSCSTAASAAVAVVKKNVKVEKLAWLGLCMLCFFRERDEKREKERQAQGRMSNPSFQ